MKQGGNVSGAVSLVVIFCVLCLAVFAVLTVATVEREKRLAELTASSTAAYYAADAEAVRTVAAIKSGERPEGVRFAKVDYDERSAAMEAAFSVPVDGDEELRVELVMIGGEYAVTRWQKVYVGPWETDDAIEVWGGAK